MGPMVQACLVQKKQGKSPHSCCSHHRRHQTGRLEAAFPGEAGMRPCPRTRAGEPL